MPNWITNKISAPSHVIKAIVNNEGHVDFNLMAPFPGPAGADWNGICGDAETAAQAVLNRPLHSVPLIAALEQYNREKIDIKSMSEESFRQFIGMLENFRACGFFHSMEWAREKWGTKWNACESKHDIEAGTAEFETAWSCPDGVLIELSKRFPDDEISVTFADEDIGCNCGKFTLKSGSAITSEIAPRRSEMNTEEKSKWTLFAYQVKGY